jgi:hypothetical protein
VTEVRRICAAGPVFDQPAALDAGPYRQLRGKLSLRRRKDLVVGLRHSDVRNDLVELAAIRRELGERFRQGLGDLDERLSRLRVEIEEPTESRRLRERGFERRE